jgi:hypothetical protein
LSPSDLRSELRVRGRPEAREPGAGFRGLLLPFAPLVERRQAEKARAEVDRVGLKSVHPGCREIPLVGRDRGLGVATELIGQRQLGEHAHRAQIRRECLPKLVLGRPVTAFGTSFPAV